MGRPVECSMTARPRSIRCHRLGPVEPEELAFAGGHDSGREAVGGACVPRLVAMERP